MLNREKLLGKVRALLSKTMENGCSEAEALAALAKARAMIDAYEISDEELSLTKEEKAIFANSAKSDRHGIQVGLAMAIANFAGCEVWRNSQGGLTFCGLRSDADFGNWLLSSLSQFGQSELADYLSTSAGTVGNRRFAINGFVIGFTRRVSERLNAMVAESKKAQSSNSTALVVVKSTAIAEAKAAAGINVRKARAGRRKIDNGAYAAGTAAGGRHCGRRPGFLRPPCWRRRGGFAALINNRPGASVPGRLMEGYRVRKNPEQDRKRCLRYQSFHSGGVLCRRHVPDLDRQVVRGK